MYRFTLGNEKEFVQSLLICFFTGKSLVLLLKNEYDAFHLRRIAQLVRALR